MPDVNGNGNGDNPRTTYGLLLSAAKQFGIHAVVAASLTALVCWFLWQKEIYSQKQNDFIQQSLMEALKEDAAVNKQLIAALADHHAMRDECQQTIDGNTAALRENIKTLTDTQAVLKETQQCIREKM